MQERNLDFETPVSREQWEQLGRSASRLGEENGYDWNPSDADRIHLRLREEEARGVWDRFVSDADAYGEPTLDVAELVFNDGRPFAKLQPPDAAEEPAITDAEEQAMEIGLERWVRSKWHELMRQSGLHYDPGHIPTDVD
jgi:hypothetical protein